MGLNTRLRPDVNSTFTSLERQGGSISEKGNRIEVKTAKELHREAEKLITKSDIIFAVLIGFTVAFAMLGIMYVAGILD